MGQYTGFFGLVARRYRKTRPAVTIAFLLLYVLCLLGIGKIAMDDVQHSIHLRDSGAAAVGTVTDKQSVGTRSTEYYFDYRFTARAPSDGLLHTYTGHNEVSREHYDQFAVGSSVPVKFDPQKPGDSHTNMSGYRATNDLVTSNIVLSIILGLQAGFFLLLFWMFIGWLVPWKGAPADTQPVDQISSTPGSISPTGRLPAQESAALMRFIVFGSIVVTLLLVAPILAIVLRNPKAEVFSPPMILWFVIVVGALMLVTVLRARRMRARLQGR
jgi:hypothetical protein